MGSEYVPSALYSALRDKPFPTLYGENRTSVTADVLEAGLILSFCILTLAFLLVIPGVRVGQKTNVLIRALVSLFIGTFILLCNFGQEWEYSRIHATTPYKAFSHEELNAEIENERFSSGFNLRYDCPCLFSPLIFVVDETIYSGTDGDQVNYNERFSWEWQQGRQGFGPQAGHFNQDFREAQVRGTPLPILWIAEYFTFDGEGIRFGRNYRIAGWYTHILLWTAFPLWVISNLVFFSVLWYGACVLMLTGACLIAGTVVYASVRNFIPLEIPFYDHDHLVLIRMHYGWCFWMNLVNEPVELAKVTTDEKKTAASDTALLLPTNSVPGYGTDGPEYEAPALRKRSAYNRYQRVSVRKPAPAPRRLPAVPAAVQEEEDDENPIYENTLQSPERRAVFYSDAVQGWKP
ncbi:hypothetical protein HPB52_016679 [Rhipicephalus sanguineus]|uniref:Dual oxidase maturation factor 1 n=1 Tax=Rhipicephalus sanguineus TaxID=34632 RepID=A0A9D4SZ86_RHISA|nr:hypothetical protein HPB52_016679 [Rhipicephalus sanguineus]